MLLARCYRPAERDAGRGVAGQAGADEDAADGTGVRRRDAAQVGFDLCGIPFFLLLAIEVFACGNPVFCLLYKSWP